MSYTDEDFQRLVSFVTQMAEAVNSLIGKVGEQDEKIIALTFELKKLEEGRK